MVPIVNSPRSTRCPPTQKTIAEPTALTTLSSIAAGHYELGRFEEARETFREIFEGQRRHLGERVRDLRKGLREIRDVAVPFVLAALLVIWRPLFAATVSRELAEAEGMKPKITNTCFFTERTQDRKSVV